MATRKPVDVREVADTIYASIQASSKKQRRLKSRTLWEMFRYERRNAERIAEIANLLAERNITVTVPDGPLGQEAFDEWLTLSVIDAPHPPGVPPASVPPITKSQVPPPEWFAGMAIAQYESEREVEYNFVLPLLTQLGYRDDDFAVGKTVEIFEGVRLRKTEADVIVYDGPGRSKDESLIVVEAKASGRELTPEHVGQARSYAMWASCPYFVVTNGIDVQVWLFRGAVQDDVLILKFDRSALPSVWESLVAKLGRSAVVSYKRGMTGRD